MSFPSFSSFHSASCQARACFGGLAIAVLSTACGSAASAPADFAPSEAETTANEAVDVPLVAPSAGERSIDDGVVLEALDRFLAQPTGRVERRTMVGVVGFEATIVATLSWTSEGGELTSRFESTGALAERPEVAELLAQRESLASSSDRMLDLVELQGEQQLIAAAVRDLVGSVELLPDGPGRLVGGGGTSEVSITAEINGERLASVIADFGTVERGGRDEWRFFTA